MSTNRIEGNVYIYKNDPYQVKKGANVSNFKHLENGFMPILSSANGHGNRDTYSYDGKRDHGSRPMHKTTLNLMQQDQGNSNQFITQNKLVN